MLDGKVHDPQRIDFLHRYLREVAHAIADGIPVIGYSVWSLFDNFEWAAGYSCRYGMIYVDYPTQRRIVKDSGWWYRDVIASDGENLFFERTDRKSANRQAMRLEKADQDERES